MIHRQAGRIAREVMKAITAARERAIVLTGWQEWNVEPQEGVLFLKDAPHGWLFSRCKAVVHHGGAGTTAAGLRAGVPNIVIPFAADQLFWAKRLHALGLMGEPVRVEKLRAEWLEGELEEARGEELLRRAQRLGQQIESEDGVGKAVMFIEQQAARG
jgi:UDP:flavonoid glycosyltransferase YjiC (YdhE family)